MNASIHTQRSSRRFLLVFVMALLPLAALVILASIGNHARRDAAVQAAQREAAAGAVLLADRLAATLEATIAIAPLIDDPPAPRPEASMEPLDHAGNDAATLRALRDDAHAGFSPAGLPMRVLAGLRVWENHRDPRDAEALAALAGDETPSILSPAIFAKLGDTARAEEWWRGERARAALRQHPGLDPQGQWIATNDGWLWVAREANRLHFVEAPNLTATPELPAWADWHVAWNGLPTSGDEVLARREIAAAGAPLLEITERDPGSILDAAKRAERWNWLVLLAVGMLACAALVQMRRTMVREHNLAELKAQFVSSVSHELRAPVGSIRLMAEGLHEGRIKGGAAREFLRLIASEGARLGHMIENVLDLTRIDEGRKRYQPEESDLRAVAADATRLITPHAEGRELRIETRLAEATAHIDAAAIRQALLNLLENAVKFSPHGGTIILTLDAAPDGGWLLRVSDQGPGIPPAEHRRVFERFHRLGNELQRETQGCGIGLGIVKSIVEAHGGSVAVADTTPPGATLEIHLP